MTIRIMQILIIDFSTIMKNFSEPFGLETNNSSLQDGSNCKSFDWGRDVSNLKNTCGKKFEKKLVFLKNFAQIFQKPGG